MNIDHVSADAELLLAIAGTVATDEQDTSECVRDITGASVGKNRPKHCAYFDIVPSNLIHLPLSHHKVHYADNIFS